MAADGNVSLHCGHGWVLGTSETSLATCWDQHMYPATTRDWARDTSRQTARSRRASHPKASTYHVHLSHAQKRQFGGTRGMGDSRREGISCAPLQDDARVLHGLSQQVLMATFPSTAKLLWA